MPEQDSPIRLVVNSFSKGQVTDIDPTRIPNEFFEQADNVRIMNHYGQGLVITNIKGNTYTVVEGESTNKGFTLSDGFIPTGGCVYNGVLFITSAYKTRVDNQDYSIGEIGSYPSLNASGEFTRDYRPLQNLDYNKTGSGGDFTTSELKFHIEKGIEVVPWETADGSVNLYITDGTEPIRVINSGFNFDGETNDILYTSDYFPNAINLVLSSGKSMQVNHQNSTDSFVQDGGDLKYGNIFFFFRYADTNLNYTHFIAESRPCQIYRGSGTVGAAHGGMEGNSSKKVCFELANIDEAYSYVQIAYLRYFSGEDGVATYESALIDKEYPISGSTLEVTITGTEGTRVIDIGEIVANRDIDDTCKTIIPIEGRLWGANWNSITHHHASMATFALLVTTAMDVSKTIDSTIHDASESIGTKGEYKTPDYTADYLGYFRTEAYPFALRYELTNGYLSAPYPIKGKDYWKAGTPENNYGIVRFPSGTDGTHEVHGNNVVNILGIQFDFEAAITAVLDADGTDALVWIKENVRAIHITRGKRKVTLEYQGLAVGACTPKIPIGDTDKFNSTRACSIGSTFSDHEFPYPTSLLSTHYYPLRYIYDENSREDEFWGAEAVAGDIEANQEGGSSPEEEYVRDDVYIPLFRAYAPMHFAGQTQLESLIFPDTSYANRCYMNRWWINPNKMAIFSPDLLLGGPRTLPEIKMIARQVKTLPTYSEYLVDGVSGSKDKWVITDGTHTDYKDIYPRWHLAELVNPDVMTAKVETTAIDNCSLVGGGAWHTPLTAIDSFVNKIKDFYSSDVDAMWYAVEDNYKWTNRSVVIPKYIGITLTGETQNDNYNLDIVNLYNKEDPQNDDVTSYFSNLSTIEYSRIGDQILTDWDTIVAADHNDELRYGGDCFIQRTYFKIQSWPGTSFNAVGYDDKDPESEDLQDQVLSGSVDSARFSHGMVISFITENAINIAMRSIDKRKTFYPKESNAMTMAITPEIKDRGESLLLNGGYSKVVSPRFTFGYSSVYPTSDKRKKARIRYSDKNSSSSFVDGFRNFKIANYKDFEVNKGGIVRLMELSGYLISIQEKAINLHYVNERQMRNDPNSGEIVFGTGDVLSPKWRTLANYGSQHQWSIVEGKKAIYGVDLYRRKIWSLALGQGGVAVADLGAELHNTKSIQDMFNLWSVRGDIVETLPDTPMDGYGIIAVYDPKYEEVFFIFVNKEEGEPSGFPWQP